MADGNHWKPPGEEEEEEEEEVDEAVSRSIASFMRPFHISTYIGVQVC